MLTRLKVVGFKSLQNVVVELGEINVFIGANGSGKSNLLEALGVLSAAASGRVDDESLLRRGVRPGVPVLYKTSFRGTPARPCISSAVQWSSTNGGASYRAALLNPIKDPRPAWRYQAEELKNGHRKWGRSPASRTHHNPEAGLAALQVVDLPESHPAACLLRTLQTYAIYTPTTATLRGLVPDPQQREPVGLSGGRLPEAVAELVRAFSRRIRGRPAEHYEAVRRGIFKLIDWTTNINLASVATVPLSPSVSSPRHVVQFTDRFMAEGRNVLTGYDASEGALYVLFSACLAAHPGMPPLFAVDNFDHGMNPRLARGLMRCFIEWSLGAPKPRQILLTTHNPLILDALDLTDDRVRLFAVDRSAQGRTTVKRIVVDTKLLGKAEEGWTLSRLWVNGEIGGVPNDV